MRCEFGHEFNVAIAKNNNDYWCDYCAKYMPSQDYDIQINVTAADSGHLLLDEAYRTVNEDRRIEYGAPEDEFTNIATMWSIITGADINSKQVALMMIALKLCRENSKHKHDNLVDIIGYTLCLERIVGVD